GFAGELLLGGGALLHGQVVGDARRFAESLADLGDAEFASLVEEGVALAEGIVVTGSLLRVVFGPELLVLEGEIAGLALDEEGVEAVVIGGGDGVDAVLVALGALEGDAEEGAGGGVDDVDVDVVALAIAVFLVAAQAGGGEEAGGDEVVVGIRDDLVAGDLG